MIILLHLYLLDWLLLLLLVSDGDLYERNRIVLRFGNTVILNELKKSKTARLLLITQLICTNIHFSYYIPFRDHISYWGIFTNGSLTFKYVKFIFVNDLKKYLNSYYFFFFYLQLPSFPSTISWRDCLFSIVYSCFFCCRLLDHRCMGLFQGFVSYSTDLYSYFCASTILFCWL